MEHQRQLSQMVRGWQSIGIFVLASAKWNQRGSRRAKTLMSWFREWQKTETKLILLFLFVAIFKIKVSTIFENKYGATLTAICVLSIYFLLISFTL